jgi:hypothetical protein
MAEEVRFIRGNDRISHLAKRPDIVEGVARVRAEMTEADRTHVVGLAAPVDRPQDSPRSNPPVGSWRLHRQRRARLAVSAGPRDGSRGTPARHGADRLCTNRPKTPVACPLLPGLGFQVHFGRYQRGSRIALSVLADLGRVLRLIPLQWSRPIRFGACSVLARMRRYRPAEPGIHVTSPRGVAVRLRMS